jgi:hypothetical protein
MSDSGYGRTEPFEHFAGCTKNPGLARGNQSPSVRTCSGACCMQCARPNVLNRIESHDAILALWLQL